MQTSLAEAVGHAAAGYSVYLGGLGFNQPFAAAHELIRQDLDQLTVIRPSGDIMLDQLIGAGCVSHVIISHCWNAIGPAPTHAFRRAVESGDPNPITVEEYGLGDFTLRLLSGARDLPFVPAGPARGTGQYKHAVADDKYVPVEMEDTEYLVMKPLKPDIGFVHVHKADSRGNAQISGPHAEMKHGAMAADRLVVLTEEIVSNDEIREQPRQTILPEYLVDHLVEVPGGSHPSGVLGRYGRDLEYFEQYAERTESVDGFDDYLEKWVYGVNGRAEYLELLNAEGFSGVNSQ
jgi:glutaconate CoA-transferase subunit A